MTSNRAARERVLKAAMALYRAQNSLRVIRTRGAKGWVAYCNAAHVKLMEACYELVSRPQSGARGSGKR